MVLIKLDQHDPRRPASLQGDIYVYVRGWFVWLGAAAVFCWPCLYARIHRCVYMAERWRFLPLTCTTLLVFINGSLLTTLLNGFFIPMKIQHFLREPWKSGFFKSLVFRFFSFHFCIPAIWTWAGFRICRVIAKFISRSSSALTADPWAVFLHLQEKNGLKAQPSILGFCRDLLLLSVVQGYRKWFAIKIWPTELGRETRHTGHSGGLRAAF